MEYEDAVYKLQLLEQSLDMYKKQKKSDWQAKLSKYILENKTYATQLYQSREEAKQYVITAPISGTIVAYSGIKEDNFITPGQTLMQISPDEEILVECYVSPADIGLLRQNIPAHFQIDAYNYNQWGLATGSIVDIAKDITISGQQSYFKIRCSLHDTHLELKNGYQGKLTKGMTLTARFIVARRSLYHLLYDKADDWLNPKLQTKPKDIEVDAVIASLKETTIKIIKLSSNIPNEATFAIKNIENPIFLINFVSSNANVCVGDKQMLLEENDIKKRAFLLYEMLIKELQVLEIRQDIHRKVKTDIDQKQREFYLHQQIKTIQDELGDDPVQQDIEEMKEKAKAKKWNKETAKIFTKELNKLQRLNPLSPDYSVQLNYLQTMLELPWGEYTKDNFNLNRARKILDRDHFGLEKIKERIIEHLAVLKLKRNLKAPILCLHGPPGVGKTSLGKSVAEALSRKYVRMSLGGLHDEAEIRGHRRTYIGAMPGRIIQNIKKAKSANPVFVLDEIDKVGTDFRGDPSYALLEVLDPEQNNTFHDNFLDIDFDLSKVLFIATANDTSTISPPLLDRMELINISGYLMEEKTEIAFKHLIPKQLENHGIDKTKLAFSRLSVQKIIDKYTAESGVRSLDKMIAKIMRKIARFIATNNEYPKTIKPQDLKDLLGMEKYFRQTYEKTNIPGIATGLAWTSTGGDILYIETSLSKGKGNLTLTGNLGDVMKESASLALEFVKSHAKELNINENQLSKWNVHIHVPEGAIPKDGPSAGITMATSIISALTNRNVKHNIAMTGEITLKGKVLPVGGIKEKILAAKRAGIKNILIADENKKNIEEINEKYIKGLTFTYVKNIHEVFNLAFN